MHGCRHHCRASAPARASFLEEGPIRNPAGRPLGSGHKLAEAFKRDLVEEWKRSGPEVLRKLTAHQLARLALDSLPRELLLSVEQHGIAIRRHDVGGTATVLGRYPGLSSGRQCQADRGQS
jgi:hypothetical protein